MNNINKVLFAYPVMYKPGMTKAESCIPDPLFHGIRKGEKKTVTVTVGIMVSTNRNILIRSYVYPVGKQDPNEPINTDGNFDHIKTVFLSPEQGIFLSSLHIEDIPFEESGMYEIKVQLLEVSKENPDVETTLDELTSNFYSLVMTES